ncbi:hypothetical protein P9112_001502 [Eukaryota sp. TZLM1-RC]
MKTPTSLALSISGVYISFLFYGLLQESITKEAWDGESFTFFFFLVSLTCAVNGLCGWLFRFVFPSLCYCSYTPKTLLFKISFTYVGSMVTSNLSLLWLTYISKVLLKSCKMVPVLLGGLLLRKTKYSWNKYVSVVFISLGIVVFMYFKPNSAHPSPRESLVWPGVLLACLSLFFDGLTGANQDLCVSHYKTSVTEFMIYINYYGALIMLFISVFTGEVLSALSFIYRHPAILPTILLFCVVGAIGQVLIYQVLSLSSALVLATVTTTRKFFTVLLSVLVFGHRLHYLQWSGVVLVFGGLSVEKLWKRKLPLVKDKTCFSSEVEMFLDLKSDQVDLGTQKV